MIDGGAIDQPIKQTLSQAYEPPVAVGLLLVRLAVPGFVGGKATISANRERPRLHQVAVAAAMMLVWLLKGLLPLFLPLRLIWLLMLRCLVSSPATMPAFFFFTFSVFFPVPFFFCSLGVSALGKHGDRDLVGDHRGIEGVVLGVSEHQLQCVVAGRELDAGLGLARAEMQVILIPWDRLFDVERLVNINQQMVMATVSIRVARMGDAHVF